ncbi:MAG: arsenate reductase ArsC, partial [Oxalobacteraceae bacterium]|nr:arsenate reductase ArsC [Oxalobacteraceae bacterium]
WGFEDPVKATGSEESIRREFQKAMYQISNRIGIFLSLPMDKLDRLALQRQVRDIGLTQPSAEKPQFLEE